MTTHITWANTTKVENGKMIEHVSFGSFVKKFNLRDKEIAKTLYADLLNSPNINEKRRQRLKRAYDEFRDSRLQSFWTSWEQTLFLNETQKKLEVNAAIVRKETAIMAQQASLHDSASVFAAPPSSSKGMILTPASSATVTPMSATGVAETEAELNAKINTLDRDLEAALEQWTASIAGQIKEVELISFQQKQLRSLRLRIIALIFGYLAIWLFSEQLEVNRKLEKDLKAVEAVEEKAAEEAKKAEEEAAEEAKKAEEAAEEAAQEEEAEVEEAKRAAAKMKNAQKKSNTQNISNSNKHRPLKRQSSELSIPSQRVRKPRIQPPSTSHESDIEKERIKADLRKTELKADIIRA
ncbi:hypothetical protein BX616_005944, partial [Lobosporangium transversale]